VIWRWTFIEINCHNNKKHHLVSFDEVVTLTFHYDEESILNIVKVPRPMRMVWGSVVAYWLAGVINPAFIAVAVLITLFIPVFIIDPYFPGRPEN
jgi:uncharacterized ion transporter superfamily protein YfcC